MWLPIAVSLLALIVSSISSWTAKSALAQTRSLAKLGYRPDLGFRATSWSTMRDSQPLRIENFGAIPAVQISIDAITHRYDPKLDKFVASQKDFGTTKIVPSIAAGSATEVPLSTEWLRLDDLRQGSSLEHNVLELRVRYRREQDLQTYETSAFYFLLPNGNLVSEKNPAVKTPVHAHVLERLFQPDSTRAATLTGDAENIIRDVFYDDNRRP